MEQRNSLLIVDDNDDLLAMLSLIFKKEGYNVELSQNGAEALAVLSVKEVPHILSDIQMPEMDGRSLLKEVKKRYRNAKMIMMSGDLFDLSEFQLLGAFDVLQKPVSVSELIRRINRVREDNRTSVRIPLRVPITTNVSISGMTVNVSGDGLLIETPEAMPSAGSVEISILNPVMNDAFRATGTVQRSGNADNVYLTAIQFPENIGEQLVSHLKGMLLSGAKA